MLPLFLPLIHIAPPFVLRSRGAWGDEMGPRGGPKGGGGKWKKRGKVEKGKGRSGGIYVRRVPVVFSLGGGGRLGWDGFLNGREREREISTLR